MVFVYKVIVADDEPAVIHGLRKQVDWNSFNMELTGTACNGQEVLALLSAQPVHLLVTDVCMPKMDGLTLISQAKRINPSLRCIVISAHEKFEYVKKALQLGVENYLLKPISQDELNETLAKTLDNLERDQLENAPYSPDIQIFRNNILNRWVNGSIQDYELQERAELLNINLSDAEYLVCVMNIIFPDSIDQRSKIAPSLLNICKKTVSTTFGGEYFIDDSMRVVAIIQGGALFYARNRLDLLLQEVCRQAAYEDMKIFISIGPVVDNFCKINTSFADAVFFRYYHILNPSANTILCDSHHIMDNPAAVKRRAILHQFELFLRDENSNEAVMLVRNYLEKLSITGCTEFKSAILPFSLSLIRTIMEAGFTYSKLPESLLRHFSDFSGLESVKSITTWFSAAVQSALQSIYVQKKAFHPLVRLTMEHVNKSYCEDLSLKTLAAVFNVSPAYLGQLFKSETGKLFTDYVTQVRLHAARTLLQSTNLKISELICRVGIPNQSYFNRMFKKTYGCSPIEFRRNQYNIH